MVHVASFPVGERSLEIAQVAVCGVYGFSLVFDEHADHAIRRLHVDGPDPLRRIDAKTTAFDRGETAHVDDCVARGNDYVGTAR